MTPQYISIDGLNIAWYERQGKGKTLLFVHGNSSSAKSFGSLWEEEALSEFRLLAIDLPGHGLSAKSRNDFDYSLIGLSRRVAQFVEMSGLHDATIFGHSLGGHIAIHALEFTSRISAVMVAGTAPLTTGAEVASGYVIAEAFMTFFRSDPTLAELEDVARIAIHDGIHHDTFISAFRSADGQCREVLGAGLSTYLNSAEFNSEVALLSRPNIRVALLLGEHERLVNEDYLNSLPLKIWQGKVVRLPGAAHGYAFEAPSQLAKLLSSFALEVAKGAKP